MVSVLQIAGGDMDSGEFLNDLRRRINEKKKQEAVWKSLQDFRSGNTNRT